VREHAAELQPLDQAADAADLGGDALERRLIALATREREELTRVGEARVDLLDGGDGFLEGAALLAEVLRLLRVVPDPGILERARDFDQPLLLGVVVKDTSGAPRYARRGPGGCSG
jgi:hypothetical protein